LALIEKNADTLLEEIGIEFRDDAEALALWKAGRLPTSRASACISQKGCAASC
jgi:trimethylamine:corrinoid methyltransferase-like protein